MQQGELLLIPTQLQELRGEEKTKGPWTRRNTFKHPHLHLRIHKLHTKRHVHTHTRTQKDFIHFVLLLEQRVQDSSVQIKFYHLCMNNTRPKKERDSEKNCTPTCYWHSAKLQHVIYTHSTVTVQLKLEPFSVLVVNHASFFKARELMLYKDHHDYLHLLLFGKNTAKTILRPWALVARYCQFRVRRCQKGVLL